MSRLRIPWMIAATVVAAIFVMVAGLSIGADTTPALEHPALEHPALGILILSDVEPHGDNEHFGVANVGTIEVDLNGYYVAIDDGSSARLPSYNLQPGEEVNVLFTPGASANEPGEKDLYLTSASLNLNDKAGKLTLMDSNGTVKSEFRYNHHLPGLASDVPAS